MAKKSDVEVDNRDMEGLLNSLSKRYKGNQYSAILASDFIDSGDMEPLSTLHISFDCMTGIGGLPVGKIIEFTGEEGSHKSNYAWECVGAVHAQDKNDFVVWIDAEKALDLRVKMQRKHIANMNVDFKRLIIVVPETAEETWGIIEEACEKGARLVVIDSISTLIPQKELKSGVEEQSGYPALPASINRGFRGISKKLWTHGCTLIEINQVREKLDLVNPKYTRFEDKWSTTGGKGLKHWLTLRLFFRKKKIWQEGDDGRKHHVGDEVTVSVIKTRLAPVMDNATLYMYHKHGFDKIEELMNMLIDWGILYKETKTARKFFFAGFEEDIEAMQWNDWYEYFEDNEAYEWACDIMQETYNNHYNEDGDILDELAEQEAEYEDDYDEEE